MCQKQAKQKKDHDLHTRRREFFVGQRVLVHNLRDGPRWLQGTVIERKGPLSYLVQLASGTVWKRHVDHMLESVDSPLEETATPESITPELEELPRFPLSPNTQFHHLLFLLQNNLLFQQTKHLPLNMHQK